DAPHSGGNHTGSLKTIVRIAVGLLVAVLLALLVASHLGGSASSSGGDAQAVQQGYGAAAQRALPSVVQINAPSGQGSGVILDTTGNIVTNAHVVGSATTFTVVLANSNRAYTAKLVGTYQADDLAVIKIEGASGLRPAQFTNSANVGDLVLAVGGPLGHKTGAAQGIVSATGRTVTDSNQAGNTLPDMVQTSAAISRGNSGGALVGLDGGVVGISTLALSSPTAGASSQSGASGIGFAVPAKIAHNIASQLVQHGKVVNGAG
ncbi:MAG: S1C family serine protease, partial [Frankia sp.]